MIGKLAQWRAGKKSPAAANGRRSSFAAECRGPEFLLSTMPDREGIDFIRIDVNPLADVIPAAALEVGAGANDCNDCAAGVQLDSL